MHGRIRTLDAEILYLTGATLDYWQEPGCLIVPGTRKVLWNKRPWRGVVDHGLRTPHSIRPSPLPPPLANSPAPQGR